mgnify:CR=1 FL=1
MYGAQTDISANSIGEGFENDVEMYGAQTIDDNVYYGR